MLKNLPKKIAFTAIFLMTLVSLSTPVLAEINSQAPLPNQNQNKMELIQHDVKVNDLDIEPLNANEVKKNVVPDAKQEGKKVIGLFLKTMMAVAFCAIILYVILVFVKKFYGSAFVNQEYDDFEAIDLSAPQTKQDALKSFLNRTK